jgi:hypothetical protein
VTLDRLIYIGEAENVNDRIKNHEKWPDWRQYVPKGSVLCFSFADINNIDCERAEAALIYYHKPPCNNEYKDSFPFDETTIKSTGRCALLTSLITVYRS